MKFLEEIGFSIVGKQLGLRKDEKAFIKGIGYVEPYELVKLGLFNYLLINKWYISSPSLSYSFYIPLNFVFI